MRYDPRMLDEIRSRIPISRLVGRSVSLKRQGREYVALSPFNKEKTPSFFVNDDKQFYHCFSSGKHGDVFTWLMDIEGLSFPEAVERLAGDAGVALPAKDPGEVQRIAKRRALSDVMELAARFFKTALEGPAGGEARAYLAGRSITKDAISQFEIGLAPNARHGLRDALKREGVSDQDQLACGLLIQPDDGAPYDRFRDRIMFPIRDAQGRLIAFGGRALSKSARAKYLNSPETELYHKGETLYRYREARAGLADMERERAADKANFDVPQEPGGLIVAEGYIDVMALHMAGFRSAVAPLGTALTETQLDLLWRAGPEPTICFDGDAAGLRAAYRAVDRVLPLVRPGRTARFAILPAGKDPDDLIRESGAAAMAKVLNGSLSLDALVWQREFNASPVDSPERKAGLRQRLVSAAAAIGDEGVQREFRRALLDRFYEAFRRSSGPKGAWRGSRPVQATAETAAKASDRANARVDRDVRALIRFLLEYPQILDMCVEPLAVLPIGDGDLIDLRNALLDQAGQCEALDKAGLTHHLGQLGLERVAGEVGADPLAKPAETLASKSDWDRAQDWLHKAATLLSETAQADDCDEMVERFKAARRAGDVIEMQRAQRALVHRRAQRLPRGEG